MEIEWYLVSKVEYFSHYLLDNTQTQGNTSGSKIMSKELNNGFRVLSGKIKENSEEISSVTLLSPACYVVAFAQIQGL